MADPESGVILRGGENFEAAVVVKRELHGGGAIGAENERAIERDIAQLRARSAVESSARAESHVHIAGAGENDRTLYEMLLQILGAARADAALPSGTRGASAHAECGMRTCGRFEEMGLSVGFGGGAEPVALALPGMAGKLDETSALTLHAGPIGRVARRVKGTQRAKKRGAFVFFATNRGNRETRDAARAHAVDDRSGEHRM